MVTVFVSGATGFIAQHIVAQLLKNGYTVIGSVRSSSKGGNLVKLFNSSEFSYEVVPDIAKLGAFDDALKKHPEITVFLHTASPVVFISKNVEEELLKPAINGTKNALKAIQIYGPQITNVVITSSFAAVNSHFHGSDPTYTLTEESWNEISWEDTIKNGLDGYKGSKKFAEKAAWDFIKENKVNFKLNTVCPSFVFGPQIFEASIKEELNVSSEILNSFLKLKADSEVPTDKGGFIDVRDVARSHLAAFEDPKIENQRLLLVAGRYSAQDVLDLLNEFVPDLKGKVPLGKPGTGFEAIKEFAKVDNSKTHQLLGFNFIDLETTVLDSINQILDVKK